MRFGEELSEDEMNALLEEQGKLQDAIDSCGGWELDRKLDIAADALRLPPGMLKSPIYLVEKKTSRAVSLTLVRTGYASAG